MRSSPVDRFPRQPLGLPVRRRSTSQVRESGQPLTFERLEPRILLSAAGHAEDWLLNGPEPLPAECYPIDLPPDELNLPGGPEDGAAIIDPIEEPGLGIDPFAGYYVGWLGDVNGDGFDDVVLGECDESGVVGEANILFGTADGPGQLSSLEALNGVNGFTLAGVSADEVMGAGDLNSDGIGDLLVTGGDGTQGDGSLVVLFGRADGFDARTLLDRFDGTYGFRIEWDGESATGGYISPVGDINGDGLQDLLVTGWGTDPAGTSATLNYVVFGGVDGYGGQLVLADLDGGNGFRIAGGEAASISAYGVGDLNGDGFDDLQLWVSTTGATGGANATYALYGQAAPYAPVEDLNALELLVREEFSWPDDVIVIDDSWPGEAGLPWEGVFDLLAAGSSFTPRLNGATDVKSPFLLGDFGDDAWMAGDELFEMPTVTDAGGADLVPGQKRRRG